MIPTPPPKPDDELEKILTKAFNDFYDYITEKDIIKVAHEYSEKTIYKQARAAIQSHYIERERVREAIPEKDENCCSRGECKLPSEQAKGFSAGYNQAITDITKALGMGGE